MRTEPKRVRKRVATSTPEMKKIKEASDLKVKKLLAKEQRKETKLEKTAKKLFEDVVSAYSASDLSLSECIPECTDSESDTD